MRILKIIAVLSVIGLYGCATPILVDRDYEKLKPYDYEKSEIVFASYCSIITPTLSRVGTCIITNDELAIYGSKKLGDSINKNSIAKYKFSEIRKIAYKEWLNSNQIQVLAKTMYFSISASPNGEFLDTEKTKEWFKHLSAKDIEVFDAPEYMKGPITQYRVIYK